MNTPTTAVGITASLTLTGLLLTGCTTPTTPATDDTTPGPGPDTATTVLFGFDTSGSTRGRQHDYLTAASAWLNAHPTITTAHVISLDATAGTASTCPPPNPDPHPPRKNTPPRKRAATRKRATFTTQLRTWLACEQTHHTPGGSDLLPFAAITALHPHTSERRRLLGLAGAGLAVGLAYLSRPESLLPGGFVGLGIVVVALAFLFNISMTVLKAFRQSEAFSQQVLGKMTLGSEWMREVGNLYTGALPA